MVRKCPKTARWKIGHSFARSFTPRSARALAHSLHNALLRSAMLRCTLQCSAALRCAPLAHSLARSASLARSLMGTLHRTKESPVSQTDFADDNASIF